MDITFEQIRDAIERLTWADDGIVMGVNDAAKEILIVINAAQQKDALDLPSACPACGTLPEEAEHDPTCPLASASQ